MEEEEVELNMEDKEATTVEEVEVMVKDTPVAATEEMETVVRDTPGDQPDKPIQKEDMNMQEMLRILMEGNNKINETVKQNNETLRNKRRRIMRKGIKIMRN